MSKWTASGLGSTGGQLLVTKSSQAGVAWVVTQIAASITQSGVTAGGVSYRTLAIQDGSTTGTTLWQTRIAASSESGDFQQIIANGLWVEGSIGNALSISFTTAASTSMLYAISVTGHGH